jgi:hypothetical protein
MNHSRHESLHASYATLGRLRTAPGAVWDGCLTGSRGRHVLQSYAVGRDEAASALPCAWRSKGREGWCARARSAVTTPLPPGYRHVLHERAPGCRGRRMRRCGLLPGSAGPRPDARARTPVKIVSEDARAAQGREGLLVRSAFAGPLRPARTRRRWSCGPGALGGGAASRG